MGEDGTLFGAEFNGSLRVEAREERLTSDAGAIVLREVVERLGLGRYLDGRLEDTRDPDLITHPLRELVHTSLLLLGQGWRDADDADTLSDDAVFRLAVSTRKGISSVRPPRLLPSGQRRKNPPEPEALASQPTLSRFARMCSTDQNRSVLRDALLWGAARRLRALRHGHRHRYLTIDVDSLPVEVHGHQPGSAHNGHYHARVFHPLIASIGETGDLLDARLREGNVHTAEGALSFILPLVERAEKELCQVASVRLDAGFPEENLLGALERRGTPYVARVKNNRVLDRMAAPYLRRPPGRPPAELRTWFYELTYQAQSWSRPRRVILVVLERDQELFLHHFWLITNWAPDDMSPEALLALYRQRGTAEGHFGELMDVLDPALSSSPRPKSHYRGQVPGRRYASGDSFAQNEVRLLLNALAYNVMHAARTLIEAATREGWSLRRFQERVLKVAARVLVHGRRAQLVIAKSAARYWHALWPRLLALQLPVPGA